MVQLSLAPCNIRGARENLVWDGKFRESSVALVILVLTFVDISSTNLRTPVNMTGVIAILTFVFTNPKIFLKFVVVFLFVSTIHLLSRHSASLQAPVVHDSADKRPQTKGSLIHPRRGTSRRPSCANRANNRAGPLRRL